VSAQTCRPPSSAGRSEGTVLTEYQFVALLLGVIGPLLAVSRWLGIPDTLLLFGGGLATAFLPGLPPAHVDPQLMLNLFLPPILYATTVRVSPHLLRFTLVSGVLLGVVRAVVTIGAVAAAAKLVLLPGMSWLGAVVLGIVAAVFDTRLFHEAQGRPQVPRAIADTLKAREMVTRVVVLSSLALALEAAFTPSGTLPPGRIVGRFALDIVGGAAVGAAIGYAVVWLRDRIDPAPVEIAVSLASPFLGALAAKALGLSVVVVVVAAALTVAAVRVDRRTGAAWSSSEARLIGMTFWEEANLILSSILFFLAGRALPEAMAALETWPLWQLGTSAVGILLVVLSAEYAVAFVAAATAMRRSHDGEKGIRSSEAVAAAGVMTWASTRSVIGLVVALSIPLALPDGRPFPDRDLILVLAALVIVGSVVVQGLTLRLAVRHAALCDTEEERREEQAAQEAMRDALRAADAGADPAAAAHRKESPRIRRLAAQRRALLALRESNRIGDEVLRRMLREADLYERASETDALPGAGPPNP
jgi:CPA1 family monovalent cation:H+ antiporter